MGGLLVRVGSAARGVAVGNKPCLTSGDTMFRNHRSYGSSDRSFCLLCFLALPSPPSMPSGDRTGVDSRVRPSAGMAGPTCGLLRVDGSADLCIVVAAEKGRDGLIEAR